MPRPIRSDSSGNSEARPVDRDDAECVAHAWLQNQSRVVPHLRAQLACAAFTARRYWRRRTPGCQMNKDRCQMNKRRAHSEPAQTMCAREAEDASRLTRTCQLRRASLPLSAAPAGPRRPVVPRATAAVEGATRSSQTGRVFDYLTAGSRRMTGDRYASCQRGRRGAE